MLWKKEGPSKRKLFNKVVFHKNIFSKGFGLMFRPIMSHEAHVFQFEKPRFIPLTMWFVFFTIDVIFLDCKGKIVEKKANFKPWSNYFPESKACTVVELPAHSIKLHGLKKGDIILIDNK